MFKTKIKFYRAHKNLSQDEVAEAIGVSTRTYMDYENGKNEPKLSTAIAIAKHLGVPLTILTSEEDQESERLEHINRILKDLNEEDREILNRVLEGLKMTRFSKELSESAEFEW